MTTEEVNFAKALRTAAKSLVSVEESLAKIEAHIDKLEKHAKDLQLKIARSKEPLTARLQEALSTIEHNLAVLHNKHYELYSAKLRALREAEIALTKLKYVIYHRGLQKR